MKLLTDEQLCEASLNKLKSELSWAERMRKYTSYLNMWQRHQELGEYLHKIEQLITEKEQE